MIPPSILPELFDQHMWKPPLTQYWGKAEHDALFEWCATTLGAEGDRWDTAGGFYGFMAAADLAMFLLFVSGFSVPTVPQDAAFYYCPYIPLTFTGVLPNPNSNLPTAQIMAPIRIVKPTTTP